MWVQKNPDDIVADKQKSGNSFWARFAILFFFILFYFIVDEKLGHYSKYSGYHFPRNWDEIIRELPFFSASSAIVSLIIAKVFTKLAQKRDVVICLKCEKAKKKDDQWLCECGGKFEFLNKVKWVDNPEGA